MPRCLGPLLSSAPLRKPRPLSQLLFCWYIPDSSPGVILNLTTDASDLAVGAVLAQGPDERPLGFYSKKLSEAEKKYSAFDKELLALFLAVKHFRCYLEGRPFTAWTDHKPLCGALASSTERSPRQTRHLTYIAEFTSDIRYVPGASNVVADYLSRPSSPLTDKQAVKSSPTTVKLPNCQAVKTSPAVAPSVSTYAQVAAGSARPLTVLSLIHI